MQSATQQSLPKGAGEIESQIGEKLQRFRLNRNLDQATLAARAGISVRALRNLEAGRGSSLQTLIVVVRALGRGTWFDTIAPEPLNPLTLTRNANLRQRASKPRTKMTATP